MADNASVSEVSPLDLEGTPIHRLPVEVLCMVFNALRPRRHELLRGSNARPATRNDLRAGLVCRRWRAILLHMPAIWADLLVYTEIKQESVAYAEALVERSAPLPLRFCMHQSPRVVCTTLRPAWARIRGLFVSVRSPSDLPALHTVVGCHMHGLRELEINFYAMQEQLLPALARYDLKPWEDANLLDLEEFKTDAAYFALAGAATASLRELTVEGEVSAAQFRATLRRCVSLEVLSLQDLRFPPEDLLSGHGRHDLIHLPELMRVELEMGDPQAFAHLIADLRTSDKWLPLAFTINNLELDGEEYLFKDILAALPPGWTFPGLRGEPAIRRVEISLSDSRELQFSGCVVDSCAWGQGHRSIFDSLILPDVDGPGTSKRLHVALESFLSHFPDTATELHVNVGRYERMHPDLWDRALWEMVFWTRPSFKDLALAAYTDLDVKELVATAFLVHAARASASATAERPREFCLTWALDSVSLWRRPRPVKVIAQELDVLADVLARCALPEACALGLSLECTVDNAAFVGCVKALSEGQGTGGETTDEAEAAVRTRLGRVLKVVKEVEIVVKDIAGTMETVVLKSADVV